VAFVIGASVAIAWALREDDALANLARERASIEDAAVPMLWWFEVCNALIVNERRGPITELQTARLLHEISRLAITTDGPPPDESSVLTLARRHRLTVYEAAYLELTLRQALPLATLDAQLVVQIRQMIPFPQVSTEVQSIGRPCSLRNDSLSR
jgi:predicted nucleic acid-binding protein